MELGVREVLLVIIFIAVGRPSEGHSASGKGRYTNSWAVHIPNAEQAKVDEIAHRHGMINLGQVGSLEGYYHFQHPAYPTRMQSESAVHTLSLSQESEIKWVEQQVLTIRAKYQALFPDPLWDKQWHLHNTDKVYVHYDHNVIPVWETLKITGRGVTVTVVDDGLDKDHKDLKPNYDPEASYDFNDNDPDPSPEVSLYGKPNRHGTRCAGEIAAVAGNKYCGVGIAYGANIGGIRMLDGYTTDIVDASSLSFKPGLIDIYSSSWGPADYGWTVVGPRTLTKLAFENGTAMGRGGLGNIYVMAAGNGGGNGDNCNCNGFVTSIYTLAITAATEHGTSPWYAEHCSSIIAAAFSGAGSRGMRNITTTDLNDGCTDAHSGTSAATPLAAGMLALALEANPKLTWRDVQHLVVRTSKSEKLTSPDWVTNGVGRKVSHRFGYGLMDAMALVQLAQRWKRVPEKRICTEAVDTTRRPITSWSTLTVEKDTTGCEGTGNYIQYLEHVEVIISLSSPRRGGLAINITSPQGTRSTLLARRWRDYSSLGFEDWTFMSIHCWEENPRGKWKLEIDNAGYSFQSSYLTSWQLRFHGTKDAPSVQCSSECKGGCHGSSARDCWECANYKSNGVCVHECGENEYVSDNVTKECHRCHSACQTCSGPKCDNCTSCTAPRILKNGRCVTNVPGDLGCDKECKTNEYRDVDDICQPCHPSCLTCHSGEEWSCTECGNTISTVDHVKQNLYLHEGRCVAACPSGYYGNKYECASCNTSCSTCCTGPLHTDCTSCKDDSGCKGDCTTGKSLSAGAIAGIVVGGIVFLAAIIAVIVRLKRGGVLRYNLLATNDDTDMPTDV